MISFLAGGILLVLGAGISAFGAWLFIGGVKLLI